jgi:hypothetical protein
MLNLTQNLVHDLMVDSDYRHDCENYGCNDEGICRCGRFEDVEVKQTLANAAAAFKAMYGDSTDHFQEALWFGLFKRFFRSVEWAWQAEGDYYGEELVSIIISSDGGLAKAAEEFAALNTTEKIHYLLKLEYGYVLPQVAAVREWQIMPTLNLYVHTSSNRKLDSQAVEQYKDYCKQCPRDKGDAFAKATSIFAPLCIVDDNIHYQVIDGRHRYEALTAFYPDRYTTRLKKNEEPKGFQPIFMFIICPKPQEKIQKKAKK